MFRRVRQVTPDDLLQALVDEGLMDTYQRRPDYQENDYLDWIERKKKAETRQKRLDQMLDELRKGGIYMKMDHPSSAHSRPFISRPHHQRCDGRGTTQNVEPGQSVCVPRPGRSNPWEHQWLVSEELPSERIAAIRRVVSDLPDQPDAYASVEALAARPWLLSGQ